MVQCESTFTSIRSLFFSLLVVLHWICIGFQVTRIHVNSDFFGFALDLHIPVLSIQKIWSCIKAYPVSPGFALSANPGFAGLLLRIQLHEKCKSSESRIRCVHTIGFAANQGFAFFLIRGFGRCKSMDSEITNQLPPPTPQPLFVA